MIVVGQTKGETETPKEEKAKGEKAKKEKTKDKKESSKSSKAKKEKVEEKDIYFIIKYQLKKREPIEELTYIEECESKPEIILNKEIKKQIINLFIKKFSNINIKVVIKEKSPN